MFERNENVRMNVTFLYFLYSNTDDWNVKYFEKCNKIFLLFIILTETSNKVQSATIYIATRLKLLRLHKLIYRINHKGKRCLVHVCRNDPYPGSVSAVFKKWKKTSQTYPWSQTHTDLFKEFRATVTLRRKNSICRLVEKVLLFLLHHKLWTMVI